MWRNVLLRSAMKAVLWPCWKDGLGAWWKSLSDPRNAVAGQWEVALPSSRAQGTSECYRMAKLVGDANQKGPSPPTTTQRDKIHI